MSAGGLTEGLIASVFVAGLLAGRVRRLQRIGQRSQGQSIIAVAMQSEPPQHPTVGDDLGAVGLKVQFQLGSQFRHVAFQFRSQLRHVAFQFRA